MDSVAIYGAGVIEAVTDAGAQSALDFDPDWANRAWDALIELARRGVFSADDLIARVGSPESPSAVGGLFRRAARAGQIRCVGFTTSTRIARHGGVVRLWEGVRE
jgi:hypothetical protein